MSHLQLKQKVKQESKHIRAMDLDGKLENQPANKVRKKRKKKIVVPSGYRLVRAMSERGFEVGVNPRFIKGETRYNPMFYRDLDGGVEMFCRDIIAPYMSGFACQAAHEEGSGCRVSLTPGRVRMTCEKYIFVKD
jgi:hypothetical protein